MKRSGFLKLALSAALVTAYLQLPAVGNAEETQNGADAPVIYYRGGANDYFVPDESIEYYISNYASNEYSPELAHILMCLSWAAYNNEERGTAQSAADDILDGPAKPAQTDEDKTASNIYRSLDSLGFEDISLREYYIDPNAAEYGDDNCAYTVAHKTMSDGRSLVIVAVRGSYGLLSVSSDWISNFNFTASADNNHTGFELAADKVMAGVDSYALEHGLTDNVYIITGHSRGAAVANLLTVKYIDSNIPAEDIYNYNFACPSVTQNMERLYDYTNIFNVCNTKDFVPLVPMASMAWGKYGTTLWFTASSLHPEVQQISPAVLKFLLGLTGDFDTLSHAPSEYERKLRDNAPIEDYEIRCDTWAAYTRSSLDPASGTEDAKSAWTISITAGSEPITSLNVRINGSAAADNDIQTPAISGGTVVAGIIADFPAAEITGMTAVVNGHGMTALPRF